MIPFSDMTTSTAADAARVMVVSAAGARMVAAGDVAPPPQASMLRLRDDLMLLTDAGTGAWVLRREGERWSVVMVADPA